MLFLGTEAEERVAGAREITAEDGHRGVGPDPERLPRGEAGIPEEREFVVRQVAGIDELLGVGEVVLGAEPDDLDLVCMRLGELPDFGAFTPAGGSIRCVEPEQHRPVAVDGVSQRRDGPVGDIEDLDVEDVLGRLQRVDVLGGGGTGCVGLRVVGGRTLTTATGGGEQTDPDDGHGDAASEGE